MLELLLKELCEKLKFPLNLEKDADNSYTLVINETTSLYLKELNPGFTCKSIIQEVPKDPLEDLFILLMKANFLGQGTKDAIIAIDEPLKHFLFITHVTEDLNYRLFKEKIEEFVNYLNYWKTRIKDEIKKNES